MSFISKTVLVASIAFSLGTIIYVHYKQEYEKKQLHLGVIKDIERQERRRENIRILQEQIKFEEALKKSDELKQII